MENLKFNFRVFAVIIIGALLFIACGKDDKEPDTLSATPTRLSFTADDTGEKSIEITTNASSWNYKEESNDWIEAYRKSDNKLYIKVQNYTNTSSSRTSKITISAGDATPVDITIEQSAKEINSLSVNPTSLAFDANEIGDKTVSITTNATSWNATTDASWIRLTKQDKTLKITVSTENTQTIERIATIKITAGNAPEMTYTVTQTAATSLSVNPASLSYEAKETGDKTVTISTNATSWNATTDASWIKLTKQNNNLIVSVTSENTGNSSRSADIKITAGTATAITLPVTQATSSVTTYNTAVGYYYGNLLSTGYANFIVDMYKDNDDKIGFMIDGFCDLPSSISNFKISAGTYSVATTGNKYTCWPGRITDENKLYGTFVYNFYTNKFILVTGGSFTVALSGSTYTITTNFTGTEQATGATVNNIVLKYTGTISFTNKSDDPPFGNIVKSSYSASGTYLMNIAGANYSTWTGAITPSTSSSQYYTITNWGKMGINVMCNYSNGKISLNNKTAVYESTDYYGYLCAGTYKSSNGEITLYPNLTYYINYYTTSKTLDFSGTYNGLPTCIGIILISKSTGESKGFLNNIHLGPKLVLSASSSAPQMDSKGIIGSDKTGSPDIVLFKDLKEYKIKINSTSGNNISPDALILSKILEKNQIK